jgi:ATP-dependent RNA helicase DDX56/DBP9
VDGADLILPCGYLDILRNLWSLIPTEAQIIMLSATLTEDVETLKEIFQKSFTMFDLYAEATTSSEERLT